MGIYNKKPCRRCGKIKMLTEFYKHKLMHDGHLNICIACKVAEQSIRFKKYSEEDPNFLERERIRHREKAKRLNYAERYSAKNLTQDQKNIRKKLRDKWIKENPEKRKANIIIGNLLRSGKIVKQPCIFCGNKKVHGHHFDYSKPKEVVWLCPSCHKKVHRNELTLPF